MEIISKMNKTTVLFLASVIITSIIISSIPKVSSQQYYVPKDPYFVGARYSLPEREPPRATYVSASIFIPGGPPEHYSINYLHYYVLLNVNNHDPNNPRYPRYWYQFGFDNKFNVVAAIYDRGNNRTSDHDDVVWWCDTYPLSRGVWYRFTIHMLDNGNVVFLVQRFILGDWRTIYSCTRSYSTSNRLVLDDGYSVFEEVRANQVYETMPTYSFHFASLENSIRFRETNWVKFVATNDPASSPIPRNAKTSIHEDYVLIQNYYNRYQRDMDASLWGSGASATKGSLRNTFLVAYVNSEFYIVIGKVTYKDPVDRNSKYYVNYETLRILPERAIVSQRAGPPSLTYSSYTGKYYLAWSDSPSRFHIMQSYDGVNWFNKVTINEATRTNPILVAGGSYIYVIWVDFYTFKINLMRSQDGINWFDKTTLNELSEYYVGATYMNNALIISWATYGDKKINVIKYDPSRKIWYDKVTLNERANSGPSITVIREPYNIYSVDVLYLVWNDSADVLYSVRSTDSGRTWGFGTTLGEWRVANPFIASNEDKLFITYCSGDLLFLLRTTL
ncbi:MAG: hypothetical protein RQ968_06835 [Thermoproteota archaeon]|nr:hypothetical protein [Thermoproteota archaeon]